MECSICFTYIDTNTQYAKVSNENGVYHVDCLKRWLESSNNNGIMTQNKINEYKLYFKDNEISTVKTATAAYQLAPRPSEYVIDFPQEQYIDNNRHYHRDLLENRCKRSVCAGIIILVTMIAIFLFFYLIHK